jgi:tripartite-type tricarboxylate transporter receptor subunit TctC
LRTRRERIAADIQAVAADPGLAERVNPLGMVPRTSTAEELARVAGESHLHWAERARTYGVRPMD